MCLQLTDISDPQAKYGPCFNPLSRLMCLQPYPGCTFHATGERFQSPFEADVFATKDEAEAKAKAFEKFQSPFEADVFATT